MSDPFSFGRTFRAAVERWPLRVAIELPKSRHEITYEELYGEALDIAQRLAAAGVGVGQPVGLRLSDRRRFCAGLLGAWLADAVPVPLSVTAPDSYVETLKQRIGISSTVLDGEDGGIHIVVGVRESHVSEITAHVAYVMHTSGSTGTPKAVALSHRALESYCQAFIQATRLTACDRFLQLAASTFDVVFEELLPIWSVGGTAVLARTAPDDPRRFLDEIEARAVTVAEITTVYWRLLVRYLRRSGAHVPRCLRLLLVGGEMASCELIQESLQVGLPLAHVYGVTEAGITSTIAFFNAGEHVSAPWVGRPLSNSAVAIIDEMMRPVADGLTGEVLIGGDSLADGYLSDPDITARRFVDLQLGSSMKRRWYKTGDAGRVIDGVLEIVGRIDAQVKVNGARIDLAEIERALLAVSEVANAAVVPVGDAGVATRLIGFVTSDVQTDQDFGRYVRDALRKQLPAHLIPSRIIVLDALPINPHGKVDKQKLVGARHKLEAPELLGATPSECLVAAAWTSVIGRPPSSRDEGFFDAGGDSIDLLSLVLTLEESGITVTPTDCLVHPTVRAMGRLVDGTQIGDADVSIEHNARRREYIARRRIAHRSTE